MSEFDYVKVSNMVAEYIDKDGRRGKPTGVMLSGAAEAILGPGEVQAPNVAILEIQESPQTSLYPFQSKPVDDVQGHDRPVIFHLDVTWEQCNAMIMKLMADLESKEVQR